MVSTVAASRADQYAQAIYQDGVEAAGEAMRCYAGNEGLTVALLGPEGSNSHAVGLDLAAAIPDHDVALDLKASFTDVLHSVGQSALGILPIANRVEGPVECGTNQSLTNRRAIDRQGARVLAMVSLPVEHCLIGSETADLEALEGLTVRSHPQALRQCSRFIGSVGLREAAVSSTSAAVKKLLNGDPEEPFVAIGSRLAAEMYDQEIIAENIGNVRPSENVTTMAVIAAGAILHT